MTNENDRARLRELGIIISEIAALPEQNHRVGLWRSMNDMKPTRPLVHVRDYPVFLLEYEDELTPIVKDEFLRSIEQTLLLRIYEWNHLQCDRVIEPFVECPVVFTDTGFGLETDDQPITSASKDKFDSSVHFDQQIFTMADIEKIQTPVITYDKVETSRRYDLLSDIMDGILPVKLLGRSYFTCNPLDDVMKWTGISQGMDFLVSDPDLMHAAIERYVDAQIARIREYEALGIISSNNAFVNVGANCVGYASVLPEPPKSNIGAKICDIWGESSDQIMTCVSPGMSDEFAFEHEKKWASMFPLYSYGCCEKLDNKVELLFNAFPNLRKLSCSPFSDLESMLEQVDNRCVVCFKPNSTYLALDGKPDMDYLKKELINVCRLVEKSRSNLVINMKTLITLQSEPWRLWQWCDMAKEIVDAHFGD